MKLTFINGSVITLCIFLFSSLFEKYECLNIKSRTKSLKLSLSLKNATTAPSGTANISDIIYGPIDPTKIITSSPWAVTNCNNTLQIKAESLKDLTLVQDYIAREPAYFVMDIRYIRKFKDSNTKCPSEVAYMGHLKEVPQILQGSSSCIKFSSSFNETDSKFSMCLKTPGEAAQILDAFSKFQICRMGGSLEPYDPLQVEELLQATCMSIPKKHKEDERDTFKDITKDKNGKPLPRINVQAVKDFFKKQLVASGFIVKDKLEEKNAGFSRKKDLQHYTYEKTGNDGKKVKLTVPGTPLPPVPVDASKQN